MIPTAPKIKLGTSCLKYFRGYITKSNKGQSFTKAPMLRKTPDRTGLIFGFEIKIIETTAKKVGTTSNLVKASGPIKTGHNTQNQAPPKPLSVINSGVFENLFNPKINKVIKTNRSKIIIKIIKPVKALPKTHCGVAKTTPANGGYCHIESLIGKIPLTKPWAQKL